MKIRNRLLKSGFIAFCIFGIVSVNSQTIPYVNSPSYSYYPYHYSNPTTFNGTYNSGVQAFTDIQPDLNVTNVSNNSVYSIKGKHLVHISAGSSATNFNSGSFHAFTDGPPFEVVSFHPNGFSNIPKYDKFELGLALPTDINQRVDDFFGDYVQQLAEIVGPHHGYGCEYRQAPEYPNNLNPYDPDQVSVEATISCPEETKIIYGFYYREYKYSTGDPQITQPDYGSTKWIENTDLRHHWRVRFAPKYTGIYQITWTIKVNGTVAYTDNIGQIFTVINSSSKGFLKIGKNHKYMVTQPDLNDPQEESILPIGICDVSALDPVGFGNGGGPTLDNKDLIPSNQGNGDMLSTQLHYPFRYWHHRNRTKTKLAQKGANFMRFTLGKDGYTPENEHAVIYDADQTRPLQNGLTPQLASNASPPLLFPENSVPSQVSIWHGTNRQAMLWELDRMLDMAASETSLGNDIYFQLVLESHDQKHRFKDDNNTVNDTWKTFNPYAKDGLITQPLLDNTVRQVFEHPNAIHAYKKKLRYIISRYGYSTQIAAFELFNEYRYLKDQLNQGENGLDEIFGPWLAKMTDYIRDSLDHTDHLLTSSSEFWGGGLNVPQIANLDFMSTHPYHDQFGGNSWYGAFQTYKQFHDYNMLWWLPKAPLPYQAGEMAVFSSGGHCDAASEYMNPTFHSLLWSTTFAGSITSGLEMWEWATEDWPQSHICGNSSPNSFAPLRAFISNVNFDGANYIPKYFPTPTNPNNPLECFYLIENNGTNANRALGYVRNKTFWWENFANPYGPFYDVQIYNYPPFNSTNYIVPPPTSTGNFDPIKIEGLTPFATYDLEWYNTYIDPAFGDPLISVTPFQAPSTGIYYIQPPEFTGYYDQQEYAFKIKPDLVVGGRPSNNYSDSLSTSIIQTVSKTHPIYGKLNSVSSGLSNNFIKIFPNPGGGLYSIAVKENDSYTVDVFNTVGSLVKSTSFTGTNQKIDIQNLSPGLYQFVIRPKNGPAQSIKVIKE